MTRTKTTVVTQKKTQARPTLQPPAASSDTSEAPVDVRRREGDDEETKQDGITAENNPGDDHEERGDPPHEVREQTRDNGSSNVGTAVPMTALTAALQQMAATMARMDARLDQLSTPTTTTTGSGTATSTTTAAPAQTISATSPGARQRSSTAAPSRRVVYQLRENDGSGGDSSGNDESPSSSDGDDDDASSSDDDDERQRERRQPVTLPRDRDFHRNRRRTIRDLDLPTLLPTPQTSVTTWIARVNLALEGARLSGRGDWTDHELYYILGNKLQDSAAHWWVQLDRKLRDGERTWARLKSSLLRRYGERPDKAMAEWRVGQRRMMPGETYADFAAALRDFCGNNRIKERVLLAQFYRSQDRTTRLLVKQRPKPTTPEEAVAKATEINDPIDNVAQGMENIGQAFVNAPDSYIVPGSGTTGHMTLIPGVGSTDIAEEEKLACFTNSRGVYNKYTSLWEAPKGRTWDGHMWAPLARKRAASTVVPTMAKRTATTKTGRKDKVNMATGRDDREEESEDDQAAGAPYSPPPAKKSKLTARHSKATVRQAKGTSTAQTTTDAARGSRTFAEVKCCGCNQLGHMARECPDDEARTLQRRVLGQAEARAEAAGKWRSSGVGGSRRSTEPGPPQQPVRKMRNDNMVRETDGTAALVTAIGGDGKPKVDGIEESRDESMAVVRWAVAPM
ncbi:unnamed protein product [Phytophthora fragariaefolia]|uniref:Unnamed protein product n=1 Tax=Phytophthora fragariaefolia TaxID=1490495 RepID=A0A9W6XUL6_9STRA|nr:unnamed protein product [Phytophthora fragariaefolia]